MTSSYRRMDDSQQVKSLKSSTLVGVLTQESYIEFISHITSSYLYLWSVFFATAISFFLCNLKKGLNDSTHLSEPLSLGVSWASESSLHLLPLKWLHHIHEQLHKYNVLHNRQNFYKLYHFLGVCVCARITLLQSANLLMDFGLMLYLVFL